MSTILRRHRQVPATPSHESSSRYLSQRIIVDGDGKRVEELDHPVAGQQPGRAAGLAAKRALRRVADTRAAGGDQFAVRAARVLRAAIPTRDQLGARAETAICSVRALRLADRLARAVQVYVLQEDRLAECCWRAGRSLVALARSELAATMLRYYHVYEDGYDVGVTALTETLILLAQRAQRAFVIARPHARPLAALALRRTMAAGCLGGHHLRQAALVLVRGTRSAARAAARARSRAALDPQAIDTRSFSAASVETAPLPVVRAAPHRAQAVPAESPLIDLPRRRPREQRPWLGPGLMTAIPLIASVAVMAAALQAYSSALPNVFASGSQAPAFANMPLSEATQLASAQGLTLNVAGSQPTDAVPKDTIISQSPRAGARLPKGDAIKLTVSAGLRPPSVLGKTIDQARVALISEGWSAAPAVETRAANGSPPDVVIDQRPRPDEAAAQKGPVTLIIAARNLAQGKPVLTSAGGRAPEVVDGQERTFAQLPGSGTGWLEVDFGGPVTVAGVSLLLATDRAGLATVEIWAWDAANRFFALHLFTEQVADNHLLSVRLPEAAQNVVRLRVATTSTPGPLGWREIGVVER